jgi:hypothetical protein
MDLDKSYPLSRAEKTYSSKLLRSNKYTLKTKEMTKGEGTKPRSAEREEKKF